MSLIVRCASALLPPSHRDRFFAEWSAEVIAVEAEHGRRASLGFALGLFGAATRMTKSLRAESDSAYLELSIASLSALPTTAVLAGWAISTMSWPMLVIQGLIGTGIALVSAGMWSSDGRLLDSVVSQVGLVLVLGASVASTMILGSGQVEFLAEQRVPVMLPNFLVLVGLAMLVSSNYAGKNRGRVQRASLFVMGPGALLLLMAAVFNAASASGARWLVELIFAVPAVVLFWACYSVAGRARVFEGRPTNAEV